MAEETAIFIAGPTASGKSAVALEVADRVGGEIVNADAMQVYADLRILTARPDDAALARVPHHLYGTVDASEKFSAGIWARRAASIIDEIRARGAVPVIAGGTGLYFKALEEGLSPIPEIPDDVREAGLALYDEIGPEAFRDQVMAYDPAMARLPENDRQRLVRAWEVHEATGTPLSAFQARPRVPLLDGTITKCVIEPKRARLYAACDDRFEAMLTAGALDEVRILAARNLDPELPAMKSLGVPELVDHLADEITLTEAAELAKRNTRRFAKRQTTWFNGQAGDWPRCATAKEAVAFLAENCSKADRPVR